MYLVMLMQKNKKSSKDGYRKCNASIVSCMIKFDDFEDHEKSHS